MYRDFRNKDFANPNPFGKPKVAAKPTEDEPVVVKPAENESVVAKPAENESVVAKSAEKEPVVAKPAENESVVAKPAKKESVAGKPAEKKSVVVKAAKNKVPKQAKKKSVAAEPADSKVLAAEPADSKVLAAEPDDSKVLAAEPDDSKVLAAEPAEVETANGEQAAAAAAEPKQEVDTNENMNKHPLQNSWTLWYLENDRTKSWEEMQNEITSFETIEDFWSLYNHIKPPSEIKMGSDYSLFKKGVRPMWEDNANKEGGRWVLNLNKSAKSDLDNGWLDVLLCLIGEAFDSSDEICGAVVNIRKQNNKISLWTAHAYNAEAILEIGKKLREALHLNPNTLQYQNHKDTMNKSLVKPAYTL